MPFPVPTGWVPPEELARQQLLYSGESLSDPNQPIEYSFGATGVGTQATPEQLARQQANQYVTPQGADASYYYIPDSGPVMTGYTPEQREAIESAQRDARISGIGSVAALVGGAAALGATPWGSTTTGSGTATVSGANTAAGVAAPGATTYPLATGGPITGSAIPGVTSGTTAAGATAAGIGGAAATGGNFLQNWLPHITTGVNSLLGYSAADKAADAESAALQAGIDEQRRQYDTTRQDLMPWMQAGQGALNNLQNPNAFTASPGYEWARSEGQRDIGNSFAARGGAASGNALRALSEFNTGLAQQDYGNWWNRQAGLAGVGQAATTNVAGFGQNMAGNVGNFLAGQGASRASGVMGKYGSLANGLNEGVTNWLYRRRAA